MQVVEHEQDRYVIRARRKQLRQGVEQRETLRVRVGPHTGLLAEEVDQLGQHAGELVDTAHGSESRRAERGREDADRLDERLEWCGEILVAAAVEHEPTIRVR